MYRREDSKFSETTDGLKSVCGDGKIIKTFDIPQTILNDNKRQRRVYFTDGISPTLMARTDSPKIIDPDSNTMIKIGTVSENSLIGGRVVSTEGVSFTLMACTHGYGMGNIYDDRKLVRDERFRKYTE